MSQDLRRQVAIPCQRFLKETMRIMAGGFDSQDIPRRTVRSRRMVPTEPGRTIGEVVPWEELDWGLIWDRVGADMRATRTWEEAGEAIQRYIDAHDIRGAGFVEHHVENDYLLPLAKLYLEEAGKFDYISPVARRVTASLLRHLDLQDVTVVGLIALEGFAADAVLDLEKGIRMRPVEANELLMLGRDDIPPGITFEWPRPALLVPNTDWWICEVRIPNRRGTADGWNRANNIEDTIALALRAFKAGGLSLGSARMQFAGPFGNSMLVRSSRLKRIATGDRYQLSGTEIPQFVRFWRKFQRLMSEELHYLQPPIRRLLIGGERSRWDDALVDFVIGLEALLGKPDERTELGYRFRIRGSVLLADKKGDRKDRLGDLRTLYNLRSRIVHGQYVKGEDLEKAIPLAENALRRVWNWYFRRWYEEGNNVAGIDQIDGLLVGA